MSDTANILLVDDEPGMLRYIRTLLEVDDYKVQTATTGEEALKQVEKGLDPDLVLLDLLMPGIDGLQTLENLRQMKPGVKVVMLSCVSDTRKVVQAMREGAAYVNVHSTRSPGGEIRGPVQPGDGDDE